MEIVQMDRGQGKTMFLIKKSAESQCPIVCYSEKQAQLIKERAEEIGLDIPDPIKLKFPNFKESFKGRKIENGILIDDVDYVLERLFGSKINIVTTSCDVYTYMNINEKVK